MQPPHTHKAVVSNDITTHHARLAQCVINTDTAFHAHATVMSQEPQESAGFNSSRSCAKHFHHQRRQTSASPAFLTMVPFSKLSSIHQETAVFLHVLFIHTSRQIIIVVLAVGVFCEKVKMDEEKEERRKKKSVMKKQSFSTIWKYCVFQRDDIQQK